jgi:hypothetical protein
MVHVIIWISAAVFGAAWWAVSVALGARAYGVLGAHPLAGVAAGACTGLIVAAISIPIYRRTGARSLYWYSPFSVYLSIAVYGLILFALRSLANDFHPAQNRWAAGLEAIAGMWWGVTMLLPIAVVVHMLAYANHRLLRRMVIPNATVVPRHDASRASAAGGSE